MAAGAGGGGASRVASHQDLRVDTAGRAASSPHRSAEPPREPPGVGTLLARDQARRRSRVNAREQVFKAHRTLLNDGSKLEHFESRGIAEEAVKRAHVGYEAGAC